MTESWFHFTGWGEHYEFTAKKFESVPFPEHLKGHDTIPFVWLETGADAKSTLPPTRDTCWLSNVSFLALLF